MTETTFSEGLAQLLNRYSKENESNTPDFILAAFLDSVLRGFAEASKAREAWYGVELAPARPLCGECGGPTR